MILSQIQARCETGNPYRTAARPACASKRDPLPQTSETSIGARALSHLSKSERGERTDRCACDRGSVGSITNPHEALKDAADEVGLDLTLEQHQLLVRHAEMIDEGNSRMNLTAVRGTQAIVNKLVAPSIRLLAPAGGWLPTIEWWSGRRVIDVGTGAGVPGVPMAILLPDCNFTLLEARAKKCRFLREVSGELGLDNVTVLNSRAEVAGRSPTQRECYDVAVARSVADLAVLAELVLPFVQVGGTAVLPKGGSEPELQAEIERAAFAINTLGSAPAIVEPRLNDSSSTDREYRTVYLMKIAQTPSQYPRNAGIPKKRPLS